MTHRSGSSRSRSERQNHGHGHGSHGRTHLSANKSSQPTSISNPYLAGSTYSKWKTKVKTNANPSANGNGNGNGGGNDNNNNENGNNNNANAGQGESGSGSGSGGGNNKSSAPGIHNYTDHSNAFPRNFQHNGYLDVRTNPKKPWKRRYFVVSNNFLLCAATPHAHNLEKVIPLEGSNIGKSTKTSDMTFELFMRKRRLYFRAGSPSQCEAWTKAVQRASKLKIQEVYRFIHTLGVSGDTKVVAAKHRTTGEDCAVKIVDKRLCEQRMLQTEIRILRKLDHSCIVQLYDIVETKKFLYIVMEKCAGGELFDQIAELDGEHFTEQDSCMVMHQIAAGVRYMHSVGIVHRDLKPENVLCVKPNSIRKVKIADFGISKILKKTQTAMKTMVGTLSYTAPEILQRKRKYDYTVDYWSVGVIMYILLCGYPPFWGETDDEIINSIVKSDPEFDPEEWDHVQPETIELVRGLLNKNSSQRKTLDDILQLTWKVSSQSMAFRKSRLRLKKHVIERKMRAMSTSVYEMNSDLMRGMNRSIKSHDNRRGFNNMQPTNKRKQFADDMSPILDHKQKQSFAKYNRRVRAFRGQRNSKGTEELYHDITELTLPMNKRDSMLEPDPNYNGN